MSAEQPEFDEISEKLNNLQKIMFVESTDEYGISRLEKILNIAGDSSEDLAIRKFRVLAYINGNKQKCLDDVLTNILGEDNYTIEYVVANKYLTVRINVQNENYLEIVKSVLDKITPCNIVLDVGILYASHQMISGYTHEYLAKFQHENIKYIGVELYNI